MRRARIFAAAGSLVGGAPYEATLAETREPNPSGQTQPPPDSTKFLPEPVGRHSATGAPEKQGRLQEYGDFIAGEAPLDAVTTNAGPKSKAEVRTPALAPKQVGLERLTGIRIDRDLSCIATGDAPPIHGPNPHFTANQAAVGGHVFDIEPGTFARTKPGSSREKIECQRPWRVLRRGQKTVFTSSPEDSPLATRWLDKPPPNSRFHFRLRD